MSNKAEELKKALAPNKALSDEWEVLRTAGG